MATAAENYEAGASGIGPQIQEIVQKLNIREFFQVFKKEWSFLAMHFLVPAETIVDIRKDLKSNLINLRETLTQILEDWIGRNELTSRDDLITELVSAFSLFGLEDFVALLQEDATSQEVVLTNPLILPKIYKKLNFQDRKSFRCVNRIWRNASIKLWRDNVVLYLHREVNAGEKGISFKDFHDLFRKSADSDHWEENTFQLLEYPFRRCRIYYVHFPFETEPVAKTFFFEVYGQNLTHLEVNCEIEEHRVLESFQWILLTTCKNLIELSMDVGEVGHMDNEQEIKLLEIDDKLVAQNLRKLNIRLSLSDIGADAYNFKKFLEIAPNLKSVVVRLDAQHLLQGLPCPTITGEFIKLEKLVVVPYLGYNETDIFEPLVQYTERFTNLIKDLSIHAMLTQEEDQLPISVKNVIDNCRGSLEVLRLKLLWENSNELWWKNFSDLSEIYFKNLVRLDLRFDYENENRLIQGNIDLCFDTLMKIPKLECLSISYPHSEDRMETGIFLNEENRDAILPIPLEHLKTFKYDGVLMTHSAVEKYGESFPNLTYLKTGLNNESLSTVFKSFTKLETLVLNYQSRLNLEDIIEAKKLNEKIKITLRTRQCGDLEIVGGGGSAEHAAFYRNAKFQELVEWWDRE